MAVETPVASSRASPSANRVKSTGNGAVGTPGTGVHCHQCRQKTNGFAAVCTNQTKNKPCLVKLCCKCLLNRYGEKVEDVAFSEEWICPKCRGICNCSVCMKRKGRLPTGPLINAAKATGFSSVSQMLLKNGNESLENEISLDGSNENGASNGENKPKKRKRSGLAETSDTIPKEIVLPVGTDLTSVAGIDVPAEDVGNALEFLEFCSVFGKILEMKNGEAEYILQDILHGQSAKRGKFCPVVMFHIHLLSLIRTEQGEFEKLTPVTGKNSWFDALKKCLAKSQCILKALGVESLKEATDYEVLNASEMLKVLNLLCTEVLGTKKLRNWIEDEITQHEKKTKEAKQNVFDARGKIKTLEQKMKDESAKVIDARDAEQEETISHTKSDAEQARANLLESKAMLLQIENKAHACRIEPAFTECSGHMYWKLNCTEESEVLHQDVGKGDDALALNEKWYALSAEEKEVIEKNIGTRRE